MKAREEKLGQKTEAVRVGTAEHKDEGMGMPTRVFWLQVCASY
jgi:hypothetical protein